MAMTNRVTNVIGLDYDHLPALLTPRQFAQLVQLRHERVLSLLREGAIPAVRLGKSSQWRIPKSVIQKFLDLA